MALSLSLSLSLSVSSIPCFGLNLRSSPPTPSSKNGVAVSVHRNGLNRLNRRRVSVVARQSEYYEPQQQQSFSSQSFGGQSAKVFLNHTIYKGQGALTISHKSPEFTPLESGAYKVSKEGFIFFQFTPGTGNRQYDWNRKQTFTLSMSEIGTLISMGPEDSCEFYHDPFVGKTEEGQVGKIFNAEPMPDGSGHFFNLNVQNKLINVEESIQVAVSKGEFEVIKSTLNYMIPYLLGWNTFANSVGPEDSGRSRLELEWGR